MKSLYDVLGVSSQATAAQIEQGYKFCLDSFVSASRASNEEDIIRAKAIREAYAVLSSPSRRQAYDEKLKAREQVTYQVIEKVGFPWVKISLVFLMVAGSIYYKIHSDKAEAESIALKAAAKEKAAVEIAEKLASAEQAALEQQRLQQQRLAEANRQREMEQARREGQQIHERLQRAEAQAAREKEQAERQARYEKQREEQAAQARSRNEISAMERALSIPIRRH
jgi:curved DNA-binding protein CbpA